MGPFDSRTLGLYCPDFAHYAGLVRVEMVGIQVVTCLQLAQIASYLRMSSFVA